MDGMRRLAPLLLALAACSEPSAVKVTPTDRFAVPASLAIQARASRAKVSTRPLSFLSDTVNPPTAGAGGSELAGPLGG
jgi:hypothetical protein